MPRDEDQPLHPRADGVHDDLGRTGPPRREHRGHDPQHGHRSHHRGRQQIRDDGHQAHLARHPGNDRRGHQERHRRHHQRLGRPPRQATPGQRPRPSRRQQHQSRRRHHRQHESHAHGHFGVVEPEYAHRCGQRGQSRAPAAQYQGEQSHRTHHTSTQDARLVAHEGDEAGQSDCGERRRSARPTPQHPRQQQHRSAHNGHVGTRNRGQMRHPRFEELLLDTARQRTRVTDDQTRQQTRRLLLQHAGDEPELLPQCLGGSLPPRWFLFHVRRATHVPDRDRHLVRTSGRQLRTHRHTLSGKHAVPGFRGAQEQHSALGADVLTAGHREHNVDGNKHRPAPARP